MVGSAYIGYFGYRAAMLAAPGAWDDLLAGRGAAPDQYRVGIMWLAHWIMLYGHVNLAFALASIDLVTGLIAALLLLEILRRTAVYRSADAVGRWLGCAALLVAVQWSMGWLFWLKKPETMVAAMFAVAMLWLWQEPAPGNASPRHTNSGRITSLLLALSLALATVRADVAVALNLGVLAVAVGGGQLSLPRVWAGATSLVGALIAGGLQIWLMRVVYPQASYGRVKLWQLVPNLVHGSRWPPFLVFMLPVGWVAAQIVRRKFSRDAAGLAVLVGAALYLPLWFTVGKIDEVRIVIPLALALVPLTAQLVMLRAREAVIAKP
jgi:hypothetical protein